MCSELNILDLSLQARRCRYARTSSEIIHMISVIYFLTSLNKKSAGVAAVAVEGDETVLFYFSEGLRIHIYLSLSIYISILSINKGAESLTIKAN